MVVDTVDKEAVEKAEENGHGQCYCEEGDDTGRLDERNSSGNMLGCRSLNCTMIKRDGLIVARSNHFVEMERKMEAVTKDEELGRREWVLAEKNMVGPPQEKDSDFFYKLRSFLKRRGRKPHKQNRVYVFGFLAILVQITLMVLSWETSFVMKVLLSVAEKWEGSSLHICSIVVWTLPQYIEVFWL